MDASLSPAVGGLKELASQNFLNFVLPPFADRRTILEKVFWESVSFLDCSSQDSTFRGSNLCYRGNVAPLGFCLKGSYREYMSKDSKVKIPSPSINKEHHIPTIGEVFQDGRILETMFCPETQTTSFALWNTEDSEVVTCLSINSGEQLIPYSPQNNLIKHKVILFPSVIGEYGSESELVSKIRAYIHRYVDLTPFFETIAAYYVLFSWVYDGFNELPYLRVKGDPGCGKTRFLLIVGSICYRPIFASGASTMSPIFRMLDTFRGTLVIDESDFRMSDEKAEMVKILNNGNVKGFPVLRSESNGKGEFNPAAFNVFTPKLIATRRDFDDIALESRCLTEEMGQSKLRSDIPINLGEEYAQEAANIRNQLLKFRFNKLSKCKVDATSVDMEIEPRLNQIFMPLLSIIEDDSAREELKSVLRNFNSDMINRRSMETEAQVLEVIHSLQELDGTRRVSVMDITSRFSEVFGEEYDRKISNKWIGFVLRKRLFLKTEKHHGTFVLPESEHGKLQQLYLRYGVGEGHSDG